MKCVPNNSKFTVGILNDFLNVLTIFEFILECFTPKSLIKKSTLVWTFITYTHSNTIINFVDGRFVSVSIVFCVHTKSWKTYLYNLTLYCFFHSLQ